MYVIMGGTGHVGSATAEALLRLGEPVTILTRNAERASAWRARGADIVEADIADAASMRAAFARGRRALILNPPANPATDTDATERRTIAQILHSLERTELEKVVAVSTGGAREGERLGDLNTLWELEAGLLRRRIPVAINRGAYYMSNWDAALDSVRQTGVLQSLFPADLLIPMVAPSDLGEAAARRLRSGLDDVGIIHVEGPARYTPEDVARAFAHALKRPVRLEVVPRAKWLESFRCLGFSEPAAKSYVRMIALMVEERFHMPGPVIRGDTLLTDHIEALVGGH